MPSSNDQLLNIDKDSIKQFFMKYENSGIHYHNWQHVESVAKRALFLAKEEDVIDITDLFVLELACYFHDIGYDTSKDESENIANAVNLFSKYAENEYRLPEDLKNRVRSLIEATQYPHEEAKTTLEAIIQDANLTQCWDHDPYDILKYLKAEGREINYDLLFPEINDLNTNTAKRLQHEHQQSIKFKISQEIRNRALYDVLQAYRGNHTQQNILQSLECLKLVHECFPDDQSTCDSRRYE